MNFFAVATVFIDMKSASVTYVKTLDYPFGGNLGLRILLADLGRRASQPGSHIKSHRIVWSVDALRLRSRYLAGQIHRQQRKPQISQTFMSICLHNGSQQEGTVFLSTSGYRLRAYSLPLLPAAGMEGCSCALTIACQCP